MNLGNSTDLIDYTKTLDCIHCGLCLRTCPTYQLTGSESSSPRGRIHLMRAVAEKRLVPDRDFGEEMDFCLLCRHCESVCPAGVRFGEMMEHTRAGLEQRRPREVHARFLRWLGFRQLLPSRGALRLSAAALRVGQRSGLLKLASRLGAQFPGSLGQSARGLAELPEVPPASERRLLPEHLDADPGQPALGSVALLEGCVMPELFGRVNRASARLLTRVGYEVRVPRAQGCCGSLQAHNGDLEGARAQLRLNIEAFAGASDWIALNSAGCGSHLRAAQQLFEEQDPWHARAAAFSARVRDLSELLEPQLGRLSLRLATPLRATYDDPCHLCHGQGVRRQPRALLAAVEGLELVEMPDSESCCGSAGIYSLLRPADSRAILEPKLDSLAESGARLLVTANPGCQMQWQAGVQRRGLKVRVLHLAELLAAAAEGAELLAD